MDIDTLYDFLKIPSHYLEWPLILTHVIIPFIFFWYAMKCFLDKIGIFRFSNVNGIIAFLIAFSSLFFVSSLGLLLTPVSIGMIGIFKLHGKSKIIFIAIGIILYWLILPILMSYIS